MVSDNKVGNSAAMREALVKLQSRFQRNVEAYYDRYIKFTGWHWTKKAAEAKKWCDIFSELNDKCKAAIAEPPRNCDVGTADDQRKRFREFCESHSWHEIDGEHCSAKCPLYHGDRVPCDELEWAQMPYEEGAANGR